jgi:hypothetical protein
VCACVGGGGPPKLKEAVLCGDVLSLPAEGISDAIHKAEVESGQRGQSKTSEKWIDDCALVTAALVLAQEVSGSEPAVPLLEDIREDLPQE